MIVMETAQEPSIEEMTEQIKKAVRNGSVGMVQHLPREAFIQAAWEGIANYHVELTLWGSTLSVRQFELEKDARLDLLNDEERERAIKLANDWLDDNFDK